MRLTCFSPSPSRKGLPPFKRCLNSTKVTVPRSRRPRNRNYFQIIPLQLFSSSEAWIMCTGPCGDAKSGGLFDLVARTENSEEAVVFSGKLCLLQLSLGDRATGGKWPLGLQIQKNWPERGGVPNTKK